MATEADIVLTLVEKGGLTPKQARKVLKLLFDPLEGLLACELLLNGQLEIEGLLLATPLTPKAKVPVGSSRLPPSNPKGTGGFGPATAGKSAKEREGQPKAGLPRHKVVRLPGVSRGNRGER